MLPLTNTDSTRVPGVANLKNHVLLFWAFAVLLFLVRLTFLSVCDSVTQSVEWKGPVGRMCVLLILLPADLGSVPSSSDTLDRTGGMNDISLLSPYEFSPLIY